MLLVFAYKEWPIQRELRELRGWANQIHGPAGLRPAGCGQHRYGQDPGYPQNPGYPAADQPAPPAQPASSLTKIAVPGKISPRSGDH